MNTWGFLCALGMVVVLGILGYLWLDIKDFIKEFFSPKKTAKDFSKEADKARARNEPKDEREHYKLVTAQLKRFYKAANKCAKRGSYGFMFREPTLYPEVKTEILAQGFKLERVIPDNDKGDRERWHVTFV